VVQESTDAEETIMPARKQLYFIKPRVLIRMRKNWDMATRRQMYFAFGEWIESIYPEVVAAAPVYKGPKDERREPPGFLRGSLKIVWTKGSHDILYKTISVPNARPGTRNYRALMAIYSMHNQRKRFIITPTGKKFLTFPVASGKWKGPRYHGPGVKVGPKNWAIIHFARQGHYKHNPFIARVAHKRKKGLAYFLKRELEGKRFVTYKNEKYDLTK